ncbi:unnamed protein product, partial [Closterium sp. NIES-53]
MRSVTDCKRPQKMGSSRMDHGGTSDLHDYANAALSNPILLMGTLDGKVLAEPLAELETDCADPRDQDINNLTLAAQGEDCGVLRVVLNNQQKVALAALSTDVGWAPHVHVESLQGSSRRGKRGGVRSGALPPLDARKARWGSPSATTPTAATTATPTAATADSTKAPTPATTPTTATASTASTTSTAAPTTTSAATTTTPATLSLAAAALCTSRSSPDVLSTKDVNSSRRGVGGGKGGGGAPLKEGRGVPRAAPTATTLVSATR